MKHVDIDSTNLRSAGYDQASRTLEVIFQNGGHFRYTDVAPEKFDQLITADSPGGYFHREIRNAHNAERVERSTEEPR